MISSNSGLGLSGGGGGGSSYNAAFSSLGTNVNQANSNLTSATQTLDPTNPEDELQLQQYLMQYQMAITTESQYISTMQQIATTVISNMK